MAGAGRPPGARGETAIGDTTEASPRLRAQPAWAELRGAAGIYATPGGGGRAAALRSPQALGNVSVRRRFPAGRRGGGAAPPPPLPGNAAERGGVRR